MNKLLLSLCLLVLCALCSLNCNAVQFSPYPRSSRICRLDENRMQSLLTDGKVLFEIVIPAKAGKAVRFAAQELSEQLSRVTGQTLPVLRRKSGNKVALIVGDRELALRHHLDVEKLDQDGFFIQTIGRDVLMVGQDDARQVSVNTKKGSLYAVYDFLERFAGVRFYFPGEIGTVAPRRQNWEIPHISIVDRPDFQHRRTYVVKLPSICKMIQDPRPEDRVAWYDSRFKGNREIMPQYRLATNYRLREHTANLPNCHGLRYLGLKERFGQKHPEYFALDDLGARKNGSHWTHPNDKAGQLCFSNPDLFEEIYQDAKAILTRQSPESRNALLPNGKSAWNYNYHTPGEFFCVMPNDSCYLCRCPECWKHFSGSHPGHYDQSTTDYIWRFMSGIARRLQQEKIPGYVTTLAYSQYRGIPSFDLPDNMIIQVAVTGPWNETRGRNMKDDQLIRDWARKIGSKIYLWTYPSKYWMKIPYVPNMAPRAVGNYFKRQAPYIFGAFMEAESDQWIFGYLNYYVFSRIMWNKDTDVENVLDEHHRLMFGAAAPQMKEFFTLLEKHWIDDLCGEEVSTPAGPAQALPSQHKIWQEVYSPEECARVSRLLDTALTRAGNDQDSKKRVQFMIDQLWNPVVNGMQKYKDSLTNCRNWKIHPLVLKKGESIIIDGVKNETAWQNCRPFWLLPKNRQPEEAIEQPTRGHVLYDHHNLYIFMECDEPSTDQMMTGSREKDDPNIWQDNCVEIFLAAPGKINEGYQFIINSSGQIASTHFQANWNDWKWDGQIEYKTKIIPGKCWQLEVRIPRKNLGLEEASDIQANVTRFRIVKGQKKSYDTWSPYVTSGNHMTENYGYWCLYPEQNKNLLDNPDFTSKIRNRRFAGKWFTGKELILDRKIFRTGGSSVRLDQKNPQLGHYLPMLKPGMKYRLSYFIKTDNLHLITDRHSTFHVRMNFANGRPIILPPGTGYLGTRPWIRQSFIFQAPEKFHTKEHDRVYIRFTMFPQWLNGTVWIDHVSLEECND